MNHLLCPLCECMDQPSVCVACVNLKLAEKQARLHSLNQTRTQLRQKLDVRLQQRGDMSRPGGVQKEIDEQRLWQTEMENRRQQLERRLKRERTAVDRESTHLKARDREVTDLGDQLAAAKRQASSSSLLQEDTWQQATRLQEEALNHEQKMMFLNQTQMGRVLEELAALRRVVLKRLTNIFPLRPAMADSCVGEGDPFQALTNQRVRICGAKLPDGDNLLSVPPNELSAALGPLPPQFGSELPIGNPALPPENTPTFSTSPDQAPPPQMNPPQPMTAQFPPTFPPHPPPSRDPAAQGGAHMPSQAAKEGRPGGAPPPPPGGQRGGGEERDSPPQAKCRVYHCLPGSFREMGGERGGNSRGAPGGCGSESSISLCGICGYGRESHKGSEGCTLGNAAQVLSVRGFPGRPSSSARVGGDHFGSGQNGSPSLGVDYDYQASLDDLSNLSLTSGRPREEDRIFEGWDLVERQPLPPPPSRSEDVEHWTRAMFVDANR